MSTIDLRASHDSVMLLVTAYEYNAEAARQSGSETECEAWHNAISNLLDAAESLSEGIEALESQAGIRLSLPKTRVRIIPITVIGAD